MVALGSSYRAAARQGTSIVRIGSNDEASDWLKAYLELIKLSGVRSGLHTPRGYMYHNLLGVHIMYLSVSAEVVIL